MPTAPCTPQGCVAAAAHRVGPARQLLRAVSALTVLLTGVALAPVVRRLPAGPRERAIRLYGRALLAGFGVRVRVHRMAPVDRAPAAGGAGTLLVSNHVSWLDILLVIAVRPGRMLAKSEVGGWPLLGPLVARAGTVFLDRERLRALPGAVAEVRTALTRGERVVAFPEGSTWCGRAGGRFRPAFFQAAVDSGAQVQPMAVRYRLADGTPTTAPAFVGDDGLVGSLRRVLAARGLVAEAVFAPPLTAGPHAGRRELARAAQAAVQLAAALPPVAGPQGRAAAPDPSHPGFCAVPAVARPRGGRARAGGPPLPRPAAADGAARLLAATERRPVS
ncbi:1-acyl-sn-glycerol-3-phosphate acyltransferase [Streptomyces tateyamensis]|uniref:1-acyl-sn-glycerol-3-phosphate acyltransferase n=1 Tax=Streptomyces tateyamensis TaxID=565073 RepID=A0A2V4N1H3_9ACTN|nr:1-acyl-sn-glycerol-3-phosphate acyltransferase [Streptomyces tateyamensis]